jgi:hypothetical protein
MGFGYQNSGERVSITMLAYYAVAVAAICYGLKCVAVREGKLPEHGRYRKSFHLVAVHGPSAVKTGWEFVCVGIFWALIPFKKYDPDDSIPYIVRAIIGFCSLVLMLYMWHLAHNLRLAIR